MESAIQELEKARDCLDEAINLVKKGTLESILQYYQVGHEKGGSAHLPTTITKYDHGIEVHTATLINPLLEPLGFYLDLERVERGGRFYLYYRSKNKEFSTPTYIAEFRISGMKVSSAIDFVKSILSYEKLIQKEKRTLELWLQEKQKSENFLKENSKFPKRFFLSIRLKEHQDFLDGFEERYLKETRKANEEIFDYQKQISKYKEILSAIPLLNQVLSSLGFSCERYLNASKRRYYLRTTRDPSKNHDFSQQFSSGVWTFKENYLAFDADSFDDEEINDEDILIQKKYSNQEFKNFASHYPIDDIVFSPSLEELDPSFYYEKGDFIKLIDKATSFDNCSIESIRFHYDNVNYEFTKNGKVAIQGDTVDFYQALEAEPIRFLMKNGNDNQE